MKTKGLNSNQLKLIAIIAMTIDHLAWTFFPGNSTKWYVVLFHIIGRLTAPIMCFFIAEGYYHTRNVKKYAARLFALAFISHFAYNFCFGISFVPFQNGILNQTGVVWSLAWGLVLLIINDSERIKEWQKYALMLLICVITFPADWSCVAAISIFFIGVNRGSFKKQMTMMMLCIFLYSLVYFFFVDKLYGLVQMFTCLSIPLLRLYNGERGECKKMGKLFYIYYPLHLVLCGVISCFIR